MTSRGVDPAEPTRQLVLPLFDPPAPTSAVPVPSPAEPCPTMRAPADAGHGTEPRPPAVRQPQPTPGRPSSAGTHWPHPRASRALRMDEHHIEYELKRGRRRTIGFSVGAEGLSVSAPRWVGIGEIEAALREKSRWVLRKLAEQRERRVRIEAARIDWREGAELPFLGEPLVLVLDPRATGVLLGGDPGGLPGVARRTLHIGLPPTASAAQIKDAVQGWLQRQARRIFEERCRHFAAQLGVRVRRLSLSSAQTRWGSASADGSIRLNWRLVHFALPTIDYVVAHELAHLRVMDHSPQFWAVVRSVVPDVDSIRGRLREDVLPLLD